MAIVISIEPKNNEQVQLRLTYGQLIQSLGYQHFPKYLEPKIKHWLDSLIFMPTAETVLLFDDFSIDPPIQKYMGADFANHVFGMLTELHKNTLETEERNDQLDSKIDELKELNSELTIRNDALEVQLADIENAINDLNRNRKDADTFFSLQNVVDAFFGKLKI